MFRLKIKHVSNSTFDDLKYVFDVYELVCNSKATCCSKASDEVSQGGSKRCCGNLCNRIIEFASLPAIKKACNLKWMMVYCLVFISILILGCLVLCICSFDVWSRKCTRLWRQKGSSINKRPAQVELGDIEEKLKLKT